MSIEENVLARSAASGGQARRRAGGATPEELPVVTAKVSDESMDEARGRALFGDRYPVISQYVDILARRGVERGLIGPREVHRLWERHIINSVAIADLLAAGSTAIDVGSGAGLPGIPLALRRPDLRMTLLEPLLRRVTFLGEVVEELALSAHVNVVRGRAEGHRSTYDAVLSRAVAPLGRLIDWCVPLLAPGGAMLALKGQSAEREVAAADPVLQQRGLRAEVLSVEADPGAGPTTVVRVSMA